MGLPWPPTWEEGRGCGTCAAAIFSNRTPIFVYAFAQGIGKCPGADPLAPDPNLVIRMTQHPVNACQWSATWTSGAWQYAYVYWLTGVRSFMVIQITPAGFIFYSEILATCRDSFANQLVCGPPIFPVFSGGSVNCFW